MKALNMSLDDDVYEALKLQKKMVELFTEHSETMEEFVVRLIAIGSTSLGRAMIPQNDKEMSEFALFLVGEAAETPDFFARKEALMKARKKLGLQE